jgi:hypothetical protein
VAERGGGPTWAWRRRAMIDVALPLDPEAGEGWDDDAWDLGIVTGCTGLF